MANNTATDINILEQLVVFKLGKEEYGANIQQIKEILEIPVITRMPKTADFISGIISLRGQVIAVINLNKRFLLEEQPETSSQHIIVVDLEENPTGMIVDEVVDVLRVTEGNIDKTPSLIETNIDDEYIEGIIRVEDRLIILLDLFKILSGDEISQLKEINVNEEESVGEQVISD